jgi:hypothetical protein
MAISPIYIDLANNLINGYGYEIGYPEYPYQDLSVTCPAIDVTALPPVLTYDCIDGQCTINPTGAGQFLTIEDCLNSGCSPPQPPPAEAGMGAGLALLAGLFFLAIATGKKRE